MTRLQLRIGGMHCSFCARNIERAYERTEGVESVAVSLAPSGPVPVAAIAPV